MTREEQAKDDVYTSTWNGEDFIYFDDEEQIFASDTSIVAWIELPQSPKFD